jgi:TPR repeat protein
VNLERKDFIVKKLFVLCVFTITCLTASAASSLADLQENAVQGDPAAQLELGSKYLYGDGVPKI